MGGRSLSSALTGAREAPYWETMLNPRLFFLALFAASLTHAAAPSVVIDQPWVRATVPGQDVAGGYMQIESRSAAKLVKVDSPLARVAQIHRMSMRDGIMHMQELRALDLPAGQRVPLTPGGDHIMLIGLSRQLKPGEQVPLKLHVTDAQGQEAVIDIVATVRDGP
jgi:copper(I)-binding protein